jgi:predicted 2-oxoglutarate/Fe(II)-dependent dioxygenase YbiX
VIGEFRGIGNALAFPSYLPHRVSPVTSGRRHALVAFIHETPSPERRRVCRADP